MGGGWAWCDLPMCQMRVGKLQFFFVRWENKNTKVSAVVSGYGLSEVSRLMFARWSVRVADNGKSIGEVAEKLNRKFNLARQ